MAATTLPYYSPSDELPQPLPTIQEIQSSTEQYMESDGRRLVRIGPYMIKHGTGVSAIEGENMLFVKRETMVPVPRVYAIYSIKEISKYTKLEEHCSYIVMEYLEGRTLHDIWSSLDSQQKESISAQLRIYMDQLRTIPPPGYYGSLGRCGLLDGIFWTGNDVTDGLDGPFDTEHDLNEAMRRKAIYINPTAAEKVEFYGQAFPVVLEGHTPVFTHGDFQRKNFIVMNRVSTEAQDWKLENGAFDVAIIDWEFAGWYPTYWDFALAIFACGAWKDDWHRWVGKILNPFYNEYAWMQMFRTELWS
jgi:thiamine kinase-like enzyme